MRALLRAELRWSEGEVTHRLRTGRLFADLPEVVNALGRGDVGVAQVRDLARARARRRRLFTGAARETVMLHSPRCILPGCSTPAGRCDADHTPTIGNMGASPPQRTAHPFAHDTIVGGTAAIACAATAQVSGIRTARRYRGRLRGSLKVRVSALTAVV